MLAAILSITNAAASILWAQGLGAARVEYELAPSNALHAARRSFAFRDDAATGEKVVASYRASGYDRGHLAPAADFATAPTATLAATYRASNLAPMTPAFNRGGWAQVESEVRGIAERLGVPVRVTVIPIYGGTNRCGRLGVPSGFLKTVSTNGITIAAWLKNQEGL